MEILPAILAKSFSDLEEKIRHIHGATKMVQVDICDGKFVHSSTWPYKKTDENFEAILREERGMPEWEDIDYEFDLMISNPTEDDARTWLSAGAARIIFHIESSKDLNPVLNLLNGLTELGLAINIDTPISDLEQYADKVKVIQCMGIRRIGYQNEAFDTSVFEKIKAIKEKFPNHIISVDGGVSLANAHLLKEAGATRLVTGSAIFNSDDPIQALAEFKMI